MTNELFVRDSCQTARMQPDDREEAANQISRRDAMALIAATGLAASTFISSDSESSAATVTVIDTDTHAASTATAETRSTPMTVTCLIRYQIDPFQRDAFKEYAHNWGRIIPRCGGHLVGYFLPHEGTNDVAWALIAFDSLASYEKYRARLRADAEGRDNFNFAQSKRFILREERTFVERVDGTFGVPATPPA